VNNHPEEPNPGESSVLSTTAERATETGENSKDEAKAETSPPTITAFFSDPKISPSSFLKVLKDEKILRFKRADEEKVSALMETDDPSGERLWALMSQTSLPDAVDRWIWTAAQDRLRNVIGSNFDPHDTNASEVLKTLRDALAPQLRSKDKNEEKKAGNLLRIGICWLVEKRSIQLWPAAEVISSVFFANAKGASQLVNRAISKGRPNELKLAVATVVLGNDMVARAKSERDDEGRISNNLRFQLSEAQKKIENINAELAIVRAELEQRTTALKNVETQLQNDRHHWGHDLSSIKAKQRALFREKVIPLLSDAVDALKEEPLAPHVALRRVEAILSIIEKAKS
jgi:hypothetical protein